VDSHDAVDPDAVRGFFMPPWEGERHPLAPPALK
jgi:hypothetical protein